jgi:hypothetical protein
MVKGRERRFAPTRKGLPPEKRFEALFEAARALLKEGIGEEDRVFPTLAFAGEVGEGYVELKAAKDRLVAARKNVERWPLEVDEFMRACPPYRPVEVVDGALMLERIPVSVEIVNYVHPNIVLPRAVFVTVYPHRRLADPEHVATLYGETLRARGLTYSTHRGGSLHYDFYGGALHIELKHEREDANVELLGADFEPKFPTPARVREYYKMLVGTPESFGFARYLVPRSRGRGWSADTLVPAWVASYLRRRGKIHSRTEIHDLLNKHVLRETWKTLPTEGYSSAEVNQLWRDVKKIEYRVVVGGLGFWGGRYA